MTLAAFIGNYFSERVLLVYIIAAVVFFVLFVFIYSRRKTVPGTPLPKEHPAARALIVFVPLIVFYLTAALTTIRMTPEGLWVAGAFIVGFFVILAAGRYILKHALSDRMNKDGEF